MPAVLQVGESVDGPYGRSKKRTHQCLPLPTTCVWQDPVPATVIEVLHVFVGSAPVWTSPVSSIVSECNIPQVLS